MDDSNDIFRNTGTSQCKCKAFGCQRGLRRRFKQDGVASNDSGENGIDRNEVGKAGNGEIRNRICKFMTHFQGAITRTTPSGTRLMYRRNPSLSVSVRGTSAKDDSAMDSI